MPTLRTSFFVFPKISSSFSAAASPEASDFPSSFSILDVAIISITSTTIIQPKVYYS